MEHRTCRNPHPAPAWENRGREGNLTGVLPNHGHSSEPPQHKAESACPPHRKRHELMKSRKEIRACRI